MELKLEYITGTDANGEEIVEQKTFVTNKIKARLVRRVTEITQGVDFNSLTPESLDKFYVEDQMIILKKYEPACIFCGDARNVINYKGKNMCSSCMKELKNSKQ